MAQEAAASNQLIVKPRKHRAATACTHCRTRKVRCDVVFRQPCTNCHLDGRICRTLKRRRPGGDASRQEEGVWTSKTDEHSATATQDSFTAEPRPVRPESTCWPTEVTYRAYDFVACNELSKLPQEDVQFLSVKSCLVLPTRRYLDDFVHNYFRFVHPCLPVLNERVFWSLYQKTGEASEPPVSLFVMQALLWVSCAFVSPQIIKKAGYDGIKEARSIFYQRAKLLYDLNAERCHQSLAIGSLLLTYRFDPDDRQAASVWLSNAIHHSRAIQAHMFDREHATPFPTNSQKRLWWCIYLRDRILPMGLHRPMQLHPSDVDRNVECLSEDDFADEISSSPVYHPDTKTRLCRILIKQCRLATIMGEVIHLVQDQGRQILSGKSCPNLVAADWHAKITSVRQRLTSWHRLAMTSIGNLSDMEQSHPTTLMFANITFMYYNASQVCLANHELSLIDSGIPNPGYTYDESLSLVLHELREANRGMEQIAKKFVTKGVVEQLPVTTLAYLAFPLLLKILGGICLSTAPQPPHSEHTLDPMYCAEVVRRCDSRYDGVKDLVEIITRTLATIPAADVRMVARSTSSSPPSAAHTTNGSVDDNDDETELQRRHRQYPTAWECLVLTKPRLYLQLVTSLNHALSCGELPGHRGMEPGLQEDEGDSSTTASPAAHETCTSQAQDDMLFDVAIPSIAASSVPVSLDQWSLGDLDELCGGDPGSNPAAQDDLHCGLASPLVCDEMHMSGAPEDPLHDHGRLAWDPEKTWWTTSQDWARDLFADMVDVSS